MPDEVKNNYGGDGLNDNILGRPINSMYGYVTDGLFTTQDQVTNSPIQEGKGLGRIRYVDLNGDGQITDKDRTWIGNPNPGFQYGINLNLSYKNFDFTADFSGGAMYSWNQNWEQRWAFQNTGALLQNYADDSWHRANPYDLNSAWIPGKYPALRFNDGGHSNYNKNSTFWLHNVRYLRARTLEIGYTLPKRWAEKIKIQNARVYVNGYNLFSIDNLSDYGVDPEIADDNGLQYPQNKFFNIGLKLTL